MAASFEELSLAARPDEPLHADPGGDVSVGPSAPGALAVRGHQSRQTRQSEQPRSRVVDVRSSCVPPFLASLVTCVRAAVAVAVACVCVASFSLVPFFT